MPFDPKLLRPDEAPLAPDGELDLPTDLAALGEQLADDAVHLARCFPSGVRSSAAAFSVDAKQPSGQSAEQNGRSNRSLAASLGVPVGLAALALGLTALLAVSVGWLWQSPVEEAATQVATIDDLTAAVPQTEPMAASVAEDPLGEGETTFTSVSLTGLTGPELEAFLDLLEREPQTAASVAF